MTKRAALFWKVVAGAVLALLLITATAPLASAQGAIGQPDPTGAMTGTAKDVPVKDAANPTLQEVMDTVGHNKIAINFVWTLLAAFGLGAGDFVEALAGIDHEGDVLAQVAAFHLLMAGKTHVEEQGDDSKVSRP